MTAETADLVLGWTIAAIIPVAVVLLGIILGWIVTTILRAIGKMLNDRRIRFAFDEDFRKLDAKKHNEHLKLIGSFCNTVGAAVIGAAFIVPYIGNHVTPDQVDLRWIFAGLALPLAGHIALRFMKSEG